MGPAVDGCNAQRLVWGLDERVGTAAELHELAVVISAPGAIPQVVHSDADWNEAASIDLHRLVRRRGARAPRGRGPVGRRVTAHGE